MKGIVAGVRRYEASDSEWERVKEYLPPERTGGRGRPSGDNRNALNSILWMARSGVAWDFGPNSVEIGNDSSGYSLVDYSYRQHREIFRQYQDITKPKQREQFRNDHHAEIALYEAAKRYLYGVMNGRASLPIKGWQDERGKLANERGALNWEYVSLKAEVQSVERIQRAVVDIMM